MCSATFIIIVALITAARRNHARKKREVAQDTLSSNTASEITTLAPGSTKDSGTAQGLSETITKDTALGAEIKSCRSFRGLVVTTPATRNGRQVDGTDRMLPRHVYQPTGPGKSGYKTLIHVLQHSNQLHVVNSRYLFAHLREFTLHPNLALFFDDGLGVSAVANRARR